jgi:hypothetical protein
MEQGLPLLGRWVNVLVTITLRYGYVLTKGHGSPRYKQANNITSFNLVT